MYEKLRTAHQAMLDSASAPRVMHSNGTLVLFSTPVGESHPHVMSCASAPQAMFIEMACTALPALLDELDECHRRQAPGELEALQTRAEAAETMVKVLERDRDRLAAALTPALEEVERCRKLNRTHRVVASRYMKALDKAAELQRMLDAARARATEIGATPDALRKDNDV